MRLGGISYWQPKELTLQDSSQPVNVAKAQANLLQAQAGNAQAQASLAGQESNTARAWGKVYETAGNLPNEFAKGIEKYSAARADATITAKMSDFSTQYNDPSKMFFTPEELDADGIKYNPTEQGADGKSVLRQQIPKHEVYGKAYEKYANDAKAEAKSEYSMFGYQAEWDNKTDTAIKLGTAEAHQKSGAMAVKFLNDDMAAQSKTLMEQNKFVAAEQVFDGCLDGLAVCNQKRREVRQAHDIYKVNSSLVSEDAKAMQTQLNRLINGLTELPKDKVLGLANQLRKKIKTQSDTDEKAFYSNKANDILNAMEGQEWSEQQAFINSQKDYKYRDALNADLKYRRASEETNIRIGEEEKFDEYTKGIDDGSITSMPADVENAGHIKSLRAQLNARAKQEAVTTDAVKLGELTSMGRDPNRRDEFLDVDIPAQKYYLSNADYAKVKKLQDDARNQTQDKGLQGLSTRIDARISPDKPLSSLREDPRKKAYSLKKLIEDDIEAKRKEGNVTREMEDKIISGWIADETVKDSTLWGAIPYTYTSNIKDVDADRISMYSELGVSNRNDVMLLDSADVSDRAVVELMQDNGIPYTKENINKAIKMVNK